MDGARHQLLAGARLTVDEYRGLEFGDLAYRAEQFEHLRAARDEIAKASLGLHPGRTDLARQSLVLAKEPFPLLGLAQKQDQLVRFEGLGQIIVRSSLHGFDGHVLAAESGHHDDGGIQVASANLIHEFHAATAGHAQVGDDDVVGQISQLKQGTVDGRHADRVVAFPLEQRLQHMTKVLFVIHH